MGISAYKAMSFPRDRRIFPHNRLWSLSNITVESAGTVSHDPVCISFSNWPGALRTNIAAIAVPATTDSRNMTGDDFAVTAGWRHYGAGDAVMPRQGQIVERAYTLAEKAAMSDSIPTLGETTFDVYLNDRAFWRNVPAAVWTYKLGGYQVLKKWLSYRERSILNHPLKPEEVQCSAEQGGGWKECRRDLRTSLMKGAFLV